MFFESIRACRSRLHGLRMPLSELRDFCQKYRIRECMQNSEWICLEVGRFEKQNIGYCKACIGSFVTLYTIIVKKKRRNLLKSIADKFKCAIFVKEYVVGNYCNVSMMLKKLFLLIFINSCRMFCRQFRQTKRQRPLGRC